MWFQFRPAVYKTSLKFIPFKRDALIISIVDMMTSLLAGLVIFSILGKSSNVCFFWSLCHLCLISSFLGNLAYELGVEVDEVVKSGTGLAFVSYPSAIAKFDWMPQLFAVLFFLMLITLGLGKHRRHCGI
jgi:solute carrier family 6 amino acid transporter-like protein 5/7/9/14